MKNGFNWLEMGFVVKHDCGAKVDQFEFEKCIKLDELEQLFTIGFIFYNSVHQITISNMDEYNKYIIKVK